MIVLVGFMGAGKTTVGRRLARELGLPFSDLDDAIESRLHRTVREIFAVDGEAAFRQAEHQTLAELLTGPELVLAAGGGAAEHAGSQQLLREAPVVYLQVGYAEALRRVGGDAGRPMLARPDLAEIFQRRLAAYEAVATLTVPTGGRGTAAVCADVLAGLDRLAQLPRAGQAGYPH
jgi:shikimate kinase